MPLRVWLYVLAWSAASALVMMSGTVERLEVCQNKHCRKRGGATTLKRLQELAPATVSVEIADMSHTEHGCFDECTMGPNVRVNGAPQTDEGRVVNGVKTEDDARRVLQLLA
ncbi:hypothetical protein CTAYLR_009885 [Chrysophaeum taylorii]|uniref:Uncharacterized protein n=1 Tax=Chrysophaeum taylorii TaxID=2483200 RepID=A0AAD7XRP4_9STRA|nr:hypothetical protein CTAYLR_009885 [Chrysophaeum taylorii]